MNEREQQTIERIGNQIMVTLSCHWTPKNFREYLDGKLSELWQAALSAAAPNNGTYCIHGIKCALCAEGGSPAGTGQPDECPLCGSRVREIRLCLICDTSHNMKMYSNRRCIEAGKPNFCRDSWHGGDSVKGEGETAHDLTPEEALGIAQGLREFAEGKTKPFEQIKRELEGSDASEHTTNVDVEGEHRASSETSAASAPSPEELARSREKWVEIAKNLLWDSVVLQPAIMDFDEVVAQMADYMQSGYAALLRARGERWIPVSERYPKHNEKVLVYFAKENSPYLDVFTYSGDNPYFSPLGSHDSTLNVTHWRPLPAPPREGEVEHGKRLLSP